MGQIIGSDKISTPSHSAGTISLPPSLLTLGGRQYRTSTLTRLISADVTLVANTLYFVYAQIVSGIPALRISLSAPSVYKISNPTARLVAGFYSDGMSPVAFGSFIISISSTPQTRNSVPYIATMQGFGAFTDPTWSWDISGHLVNFFGFFQTGVGTAVELRTSIPFIIAAPVPAPVSTTLSQIVGSWSRGAVATGYHGCMLAQPGNSYLNWGAQSGANFGLDAEIGTALVASNTRHGYYTRGVPTTLSATPLVDL